MTSRVLPREEWGRLAGTTLDGVPLPENARVVVVEHEGEIVGCSALFQQWHEEGAWIAPQHRTKVAVTRALIAAMRAGWETLNLSEVCMMSVDPYVSAIIPRIAPSQKLAADHFVLSVKE